MRTSNPWHVAAFTFAVVVGGQLFYGHVGLAMVFALCAAGSFAWGKHIDSKGQG